MDDTRARRGEVLDRNGIDEASGRLVLFCLIYIGISGAIDNQIDMIVTHKSMHRRTVGDVQLRHIGEKIGVSGMLQGQILHTMTQLAVGTCDKYIHPWIINK